MIASANTTITAITLGHIHQHVEQLQVHVQQQHGAHRSRRRSNDPQPAEQRGKAGMSSSLQQHVLTQPHVSSGAGDRQRCSAVLADADAG